MSQEDQEAAERLRAKVFALQQEFESEGYAFYAAVSLGVLYKNPMKNNAVTPHAKTWHFWTDDCDSPELVDAMRVDIARDLVSLIGTTEREMQELRRSEAQVAATLKPQLRVVKE